jgi:hypothetical protein
VYLGNGGMARAAREICMLHMPGLIEVASKVHFEPHPRARILLQLPKDETLLDVQSAANDDPLYLC